jgi:hypothetical protein
LKFAVQHVSFEDKDKDSNANARRPDRYCND